MDHTDLKILAILQEDASVSVAEVANRVNLSQTPCWRRIQRLEESGVIQRRVALLDPRAIGLDLTIFVEIETGDHSDEWLKGFADTVSAMPEVMDIYRMAGDVDYLLRVTAANMAAFDDFDFLIGEWTIINERLKARLVGATALADAAAALEAAVRSDDGAPGGAVDDGRNEALAARLHVAARQLERHAASLR